MRKIVKIISVIIGLPFLAYLVLAFTFKRLEPNFVKLELSEVDLINLSDIQVDHEQKGTFKTSVSFEKESFSSTNKEFYGQLIHMEENELLDNILIGVTNNHIARIEIWNDHQLVEVKEMGFVGKMTWGAQQEMNIVFRDSKHAKYSGKSNLKFRFYEGTGFLGDIATIQIDLSKYGDLTGKKSIGWFSKTLDNTTVNKAPIFSDLKIWKDICLKDEL